MGRGQTFLQKALSFLARLRPLNVGAIGDCFIDFLQRRFAVGGRKARRDFLLKVLETANRVSGDV